MALAPVPFKEPLLDRRGMVTPAWAAWFRDLFALNATAGTSGLIVNADVDPAAAIAYSKLNLTGAIVNGDLAGSIAASKLVGIDIATVGTITAGVWQGTKVGLAYGGTNADLSATGGASQFLKQASAGAAVTVGQPAFSDLSGSVASSQMPALTGDVTTSAGAVATTIANDAVTNAKMANMATATIKGRTTAGTGDPEDLTATQATALLDGMVGDSGAGGTKGLVPAPAAGTAAAGKYLKADGTWAVPPGSGVTSVACTVPAGMSVSGSPVTTTGTLAISGEPNFAVTASKTTTYSIATTDHVVQCDASGGAFTVTLPTAVGVTGKVYTIKRTDMTLANALTIATTSAQTIDGASSRKLHTQYEALTVVSDGANWLVLDHKCTTPWTSYSPTISGPSASTVSWAFWRRVGSSVQVRCRVVQTTVAGSALKVSLPSGLTGIAANDTTLTGSFGFSYAGSTNHFPIMTSGDLTNVQFAKNGGAGFATPVNSNAIANNGDYFAMTAEVPVDGWES